MQRWTRAVLAATAALALADAPPAHAVDGEYLVQVGKLSTGAPTGVDPADVLTGLSVNDGPGGLFGGATDVDTPLTWGFLAPAGTHVVRADVWPRIHTYGWPELGSWDEVTSAWGGWGVVHDPLQRDVNIDRTWASGGPPLTAAASPFATVVTHGWQPATEGGAMFVMDKLDLVLADEHDPVIASQPPAHALFGVSGPLSGTAANVTARLSDVGSGVRHVLLQHGAAVHRFPVAGGPSCVAVDGGYTLAVPCQTAEQEYTVSVPLATLGPGAHTVRLGVEDAAGNRRISPVDYPVTIAAPAVAPAAGGGGGGSAGGGAPRIPAPTAPASAPAPAPAPPDPTGAPRPNGANATRSAALSLRRDGRDVTTVSVRYGRRPVLRGRLLTPDGRAIGGAEVTVAGVGAVTTKPDGSFSFRLPVGASRTLRLSYRAFHDDAEPSQTATVNVAVRTAAVLRATPSRLRNGQAVRFRGTVRGAPRRSRKVVEMQVRQDGRWLTFATTRVRAGRFRHRYRFTRTTQPTTYRFRTIVRRDGGWPYETGASRVVRVHVRP